MTHRDYLNLVKEYNATNSISRRKEIADEVSKTSIALAKELEAMYNRFGTTFVNDDEYRADRGGFSLIEFDADEAHLRYSDRWQYGGECCFGVAVPMRMLDVENRLAEIRSLREEQIVSLRKEYEDNNSQIEQLTEDNKTLLERIAQLEKEREADK